MASSLAVAMTLVRFCQGQPGHAIILMHRELVASDLVIRSHSNNPIAHVICKALTCASEAEPVVAYCD